MKPTACLLLIGLLAMSGLAARAGDNTPSATKPQTERNSSMSEQKIKSDLFDRWEQVWHEGQFGLVPSCVGDHYIRHDESGDRTVTRDAYTAEIAKIRQERPDNRIVVYDHLFVGDRAWFRFAFKWTDTRRAKRGAVPVCSPTGSRGASSLRRGCHCNRRSIGQARRPSNKACSF